jgi:predicted O-methyltransferase YrrM
MGMLDDPKLEALLDALHARSKAQEAASQDYWRTRTGEWHGMEARDHAHYSDKLVALERDKAEFCYALCRAIGARRIVEAGTSFGVSTLYLAAAVRDNGGGLVIGTENEPQKVKAARANFAAAGLSHLIDLREGDLSVTLKHIEGSIDFVLFDIWTDAVGPALDRVLPHLRTGAVICADNTAGERSRAGYKALFDAVADSKNRLRTMTLPFDGGLEMTVRV